MQAPQLIRRDVLFSYFALNKTLLKSVQSSLFLLFLRKKKCKSSKSLDTPLNHIYVLHHGAELAYSSFLLSANVVIAPSSPISAFHSSLVIVAIMELIAPQFAWQATTPRSKFSGDSISLRPFSKFLLLPLEDCLALRGSFAVWTNR